MASAYNSLPYPGSLPRTRWHPARWQPEGIGADGATPCVQVFSLQFAIPLVVPLIVALNVCLIGVAPPVRVTLTIAPV